MKKVFLFIVIVVLVSGCVKEPAITDTKEIKDIISSMLPDSWELNIEINKAPYGWEGKTRCTFVDLDNPSEEYIDPTMGFDYNAWHDFWFCPKNWKGKCTSKGCPGSDIPVQEYPARELCNCEDYKIFHLSLGENSQKDLPNKIIEEFNE